MHTRLIPMLVCSWLLGCGSRPAPVDAASDTGDAARTLVDGGGPNDSGSGPSDAGQDPADGGITGGKLGSVQLVQGGLEGPATSVVGLFLSDAEVTPELLEVPGLTCAATVTAVGSCGFYACLPATETANAGTLTAEVEGEAVATIADPDYDVYVASRSEPVAAPGDRVTFRASGGEVPAFTAELTMPAALTSTLPTTVSRDAPLTVTWTSTGVSRTTVAVFVGTGAVICVLDASERSVTVDESLLAMLPEGSARIDVMAFESVVVPAGEFRVRATTGQAVSALVTLE